MTERYKPKKFKYFMPRLLDKSELESTIFFFEGVSIGLNKNV
jgi:hypothetical protein